MINIFKYVIFFVYAFILVSFSVEAECDYKLRKELLEKAKNVNIVMDVIDNDAYNYEFKFSVSNLTEDLFITYYNTNNGSENYISSISLENGVYTFSDTNSSIPYDYLFEITTLNENCYGREIYSKKVKKPMFNIYSEDENCKKLEFSDFKYCKKFLEKDYALTKEKFYDELFAYNQRLSEKIIEQEVKTEEKHLAKKYSTPIIILAIGISVIVISAVIIIKVRKKRSEL